MTFTGVVVNLFNVNRTMVQKAVASGRTRGRDVHISCILWDSVGPVRTAPLLTL
jgi:hypothetical protein